MRVGLRRLRAAISLFADILQDPQTAALKNELKCAEQLTRRFRKIRKQGKKLARLDARGRHKLRIQAKKVRYASEFFADLFPDKQASRRRAKFLSALERVQDFLGDLNDIAVHEDRITAIANRRGQSSRRRGSSKRAFAAGLLTGREDAHLETVVASASDAHAALVKIKPFWR
jgi:CHAD domain-containing protein